MITFEDWCKENDHQDFLDRWDTEMNGCLPCEVSITDKRMFYFKCPRGLHESECSHINKFHNGYCKTIHCKKCESLAQYAIDHFGKEQFKKVWSKNNTLDPWEIYAKSSKTKIILNCLRGHGEYEQSCQSYSKGSDCPICGLHHIKDGNSLYDLIDNIYDYWSDKNEELPQWYTTQSCEEVWWKCNHLVHNDYKRRIFSAYNSNFECPICRAEKLYNERRTSMIGKKFGELTVVGFNKEVTLQKDDNNLYWFCECSCGDVIVLPTNIINSGVITTCGNKAIHRSGERNGNWKGGITPENLSIRTSGNYINWRDKVYAKDWYTCQCCGKSGEFVKNAHHIRNFSDNEELRFDIDNGITLCQECHYPTFSGAFHNIYGTSNNTPEQLEEFINNKRKELGLNVPFSLQSYKSGIKMKPKSMMEETHGRTE